MKEITQRLEQGRQFFSRLAQRSQQRYLGLFNCLPSLPLSSQ